MLIHIMIFIWLVSTMTAYIIYISTKRKRKKLLLEKEDAVKRYIIALILFIIPTGLLILV